MVVGENLRMLKEGKRERRGEEHSRTMRSKGCKGHSGWSHKEIHPKFQAHLIYPSSSLFIEISTSLQKKKTTRKQMEIVPQSLWLRFEASGASDPSSEGGEHALGISWIDDMASHVD